MKVANPSLGHGYAYEVPGDRHPDGELRIIKKTVEAFERFYN
jgi:hypothetical protein